jgi:hypothetical protein
MCRTALFCLPLLLAAPVSFAQGILPASVADMNSTSVTASQPGGATWRQIAGPSAAALAEYGAQSVETRSYTRGTDSLAVEVYAFQDSEGAYGAYSFLRTPDMAQANLTQHSSMSADRALALTGNLVVQFTGKNLRKDGDAITLLVAQAGAHAHWGAYPVLPQRLPTEHFIPRSDHFVLGPVGLAQFLPQLSGDSLEFSKGAEAEVGRYRLGSHDATLLILYYPTPQIAAAGMQHLQKDAGAVISDNRARHGSLGTGPAVIYAHRDSMMITLVAGAPSAQAANSLLSQVHPGVLLTWNTEVIEKQQPSMVTIVIGTFVGSGEICAFTLLGGVLFAGIRLLIKRFLPGRVFDRPMDVEIIELRLTSATVKGNDLCQMRRRS